MTTPPTLAEIKAAYEKVGLPPAIEVYFRTEGERITAVCPLTALGMAKGLQIPTEAIDPYHQRDDPAAWEETLVPALDSDSGSIGAFTAALDYGSRSMHDLAEHLSWETAGLEVRKWLIEEGLIEERATED